MVLAMVEQPFLYNFPADFDIRSGFSLHASVAPPVLRTNDDDVNVLSERCKHVVHFRRIRYEARNMASVPVLGFTALAEFDSWMHAGYRQLLGLWGGVSGTAGRRSIQWRTCGYKAL